MLLWRPESVVYLASLINYQQSDRDEVPLLSVRLMTALSQSNSFNTMETTAILSRRVSRLLGMLGRDGGDSIIQGYVQKLKIKRLPAMARALNGTVRLSDNGNVQTASGLVLTFGILSAVRTVRSRILDLVCIQIRREPQVTIGAGETLDDKRCGS
ncbi:hypothetical protein FRC07_011707 [Ceratobasidium sp. 392]|nr:hypothetical protein FRC07_011707 [Ceratobasidium sp. 392]